MTWNISSAFCFLVDSYVIVLVNTLHIKFLRRISHFSLSFYFYFFNNPMISSTVNSYQNDVILKLLSRLGIFEWQFLTWNSSCRKDEFVKKYTSLADEYKTNIEFWILCIIYVFGGFPFVLKKSYLPVLNKNHPLKGQFPSKNKIPHIYFSGHSEYSWRVLSGFSVHRVWST